MKPAELTIEGGRYIREGKLGAIEAGRDVLGFSTEQTNKSTNNHDEDGHQLGTCEQVLGSGGQIDTVAVQESDSDWVLGG